MIRTRDFFLYAVIVLFLVTGIVSTLVTSSAQSDEVSLAQFDFVRTEGTMPAALPESGEVDRTSTINRLKQKLSAGEGVIISAPPDMTSVDEVPEEQVQSAATSSVRNVVMCGGSTGQIFTGWPTSGLTIQNTSTGRDVVHTTTVVETIGSSTKEVATTSVILSLSTQVERNQSAACIGSNVIGVTTTGMPLSNYEAGRYLGYNQYALVGYALDGFPVYGPIADESLLDECGGVATPAGYQYHVRATEPFILACFAGTPTTPGV